ncbi:hypothetical protein KQX54_019205 [Cotesia glomerata]|uniref:Uncharacterized protein n=1 Tax=Cotesia glomerata TaxID=32391 RepID=A0AAV7IH15_COTGL|nr:hypothetical protein KQX54_019205 [Cotesia glomerata]
MIKNDKNIDVGLLEHEQKKSPGRSFYLYGHSNDDNHNNEENFLSVLTTQSSSCIPVGLFVDSLTRSLSPASFQSSGNDDIVTEVGPRQPLFPATYSTPVQEWKTPTENPEPRELHLTWIIGWHVPCVRKHTQEDKEKKTAKRVKCRRATTATWDSRWSGWTCLV